MNHRKNGNAILAFIFSLSLSCIGYGQESETTQPPVQRLNPQQVPIARAESPATYDSGIPAFELALARWHVSGTDPQVRWQDIPDLSPVQNAFGLLYIEAPMPHLHLPDSDAFALEVAANPLLNFGRAGEFAGELARKFNIEFTLNHRVLRLSSYETAREWVADNALRLNISTKLDGK